VLVLNLSGGLGAEKLLVERTSKPAENAPDGTMLPRFTYVWEHKQFDPLDRGLLAYIHFELKNGRRVRKAFEYDWRMWTVPENDRRADRGRLPPPRGVERGLGQGWSPRQRHALPAHAARPLRHVDRVRGGDALGRRAVPEVTTAAA